MQQVVIWRTALTKVNVTAAYVKKLEFLQILECSTPTKTGVVLQYQRFQFVIICAVSDGAALRLPSIAHIQIAQCRQALETSHSSVEGIVLDYQGIKRTGTIGSDAVQSGLSDGTVPDVDILDRRIGRQHDVILGNASV